MVALPLRSVALSHTISSDGYGVGVGYYGERRGACLHAVSCRHHESLDRLIAASQQPNLERGLQVGIDRVFDRSGGAD